MKKRSSFKRAGAGLVALLFLGGLFGFVIDPHISQAAAVTVNCSGTAGSPTTVDEASLAADDVTFSDAGGDGYCELDADINAASITVGAGVVITHAASDVNGIDITTTGNITINGDINADGKGCSGGTSGSAGYGQDTSDPTSACVAGQGGGGVAVSGSGAGGGSYGGIGYNGSTPTAGTTYGTDKLPQLFLGSGGGADTANASGGNGGGKISLVSSGGSVAIAGNVTANGNQAVFSFSGYEAGGGSGGSIYISASGTLSGAGNIEATGASGRNYSHDAHGGGGGRIFLRYSSHSLTLSNIIVYGGAQCGSGDAGGCSGGDATAGTSNHGGTGGSSTAGTDGTILLQDTDTSVYTHVCSGAVSDPTPITTSVYTNDDLIIDDGAGAYCKFSGSATLASLTVNNGANLTHDDEDTSGVNVATTGNLTVESGGSINVEGKGCRGGYQSGWSAHGYGPDTSTDGTCTVATTGAGRFNSYGGGGGSHGGLGGVGSAGSSSSIGTTYGSETNPTYLGSGAAQGNNPTTGGDGGGLVTLDVTGTLTVDGSINANGTDGTGSGSYGGGGGSGGSVKATVGTLAGSGTISADGGNGGNGTAYDGGGGGGGRIYITYDTSGGSTPTTTAAKGVAAEGVTPINGSATDGWIGTSSVSQNTQIAFTNSAASTTEGDTGTAAVNIEISTNTAVEGDTNVDYAVTGGTATGSGTDFTLASGTATISDGTSSTNISLSIVGDYLDEDNETVIITLSNPTNEVTLGANTTHTHTITDNDTAGVTVGAISGNTSEAGGTATFTLVLNSQPTGNVVITSASADASEGTVTNNGSVTFTTATWSTPQTVTVTGADDSIDDGNQVYTIVVTMDTDLTADTDYDALNPSDVSVTNTDNDTAGITVTESGGSTEAAEGETDTYTVVLDTQPTSSVTITVTADDQTSVDSGTLTFTTGNWNSAQTVTITATDDSEIEGEHTGTISHTASSGDGNYDGIAISDVTMTITDNDSASGGTVYYGPESGSTVEVTPTTCAITSPAGGETWEAGTLNGITWTSTGTGITNLNLYYRVDTGSWTLIHAGTENDGLYGWTIPSDLSGEASIKAVCRDSGGGTLAADESSAFTIASTTTEEPVEEPIEEPTEEPPLMTREEANEVLPEIAPVDSLVKLPNDGNPDTQVDSAVYYIGLDGLRHPFPNGQIFFSWYRDFSLVKEIPATTLASIPLGNPVLSRPGTYWVKIQSDPKTYYVEPGYRLRWIEDEEAAVALGGENWNQQIIDVDPAYFLEFTIGVPLSINDLQTSWPNGALINDSVDSAIYLILNGEKRKVLSTGFDINHFQEKFIENDPSAEGWRNLPLGNSVLDKEDQIFSEMVI